MRLVKRRVLGGIQTVLVLNKAELKTLERAEKILDGMRDHTKQDSDLDMEIARGEHGVGHVLDMLHGSNELSLNYEERDLPVLFAADIVNQ